MRLENLKTLTWKLLLLHICGEVLGIWTLMGEDERLVGGNKFFLLKFLGIVHWWVNNGWQCVFLIKISKNNTFGPWQLGNCFMLEWGWIKNCKPMMPIVRLDSLRKGLEWFDTPNPIEFRWLYSCGIRTFDVSFGLGKCNWMQWTIAWVHELCLSFFLGYHPTLFYCEDLIVVVSFHFEAKKLV